MSQLMLPWQRFKSKEGKNDLFQKTFLSLLTSQMESTDINNQLITLPIFDMFHPQTTEIPPFKVECFSTKMLKFQQYNVIIYGVSANFEILFGM